MSLHTLPKITDSKKRRLGLGHGSGRVKTSGRGTKGQKARNKVPMTFEGGALPLIKRLPFLRGKGRNNSIQSKPVLVNLADLSILPADTVVDIKTLVKHKLVKESEAKQYGVKVLGDGDVSVSLTVKVPVSQKARVKIEKAKGTIEAHE